jgi:zinc transporter ZupT|tara:strand:- start:568 stop:1293 length:726 start_codon:yes stop_codon:yes gene_type:complete
MIYAALILSVVAGATAFKTFELGEPGKIKLITAFTGAYLMALTCLHLLPEVFGGGHDHVAHPETTPNPAVLGAFILFGFFMQVILDNFSGGIEHGHVHHMHKKIPFAMISGLCLHAFLESMPLGHAHGPHLLIAIAIHKFPVSIVLLGMLLRNGNSQKRAYGLLAMFALMAPTGAFIGNLSSLENHAPFLLAMVIGIFMHVSTTILFESSEDHHYNRKKGIAILLGAGLGALGAFMPLHTN